MLHDKPLDIGIGVFISHSNLTPGSASVNIKSTRFFQYRFLPFLIVELFYSSELLLPGLPGSTHYATAFEFASFGVMALPVQNASSHKEALPLQNMRVLTLPGLKVTISASNI